MPRTNVTRIVVMDSAHARFFELRSGKEGPELSLSQRPLDSGLARHARDERSDKPGRSISSRGDGERHAIEPRHDYHKLAKHDFVRRVASEIEKGLEARRFDRFVLVAPRRTLGEMRKLLTGKARTRIAGEIAKDMTLYTPPQLWSRIAPLFLRSTKAVTTEVKASQAQMGTDTIPPPVVIFRQLTPSKAIETSIIKHARKLHRVHGRILSCKAVVEGSHAHHRKGPLYRVDLDVRIPGRRISAASSARQEYAHDDVYTAIREAFAAAGRQLQDYVRRVSGEISQQERSSSLRSRRVDAL